MIAEYIDGGLEPRQRAEVEAHLAGCGECYESFAETVRANNVAGATAPAATRQLGSRRWVYLTAAAVIAGVALTLGPSLTRELQGRRAFENLVTAVGTSRFSEARAADDFAWGPRPSVLRGEGNSPAAGDSAATELAELAAKSPNARGLYRAGVAAMAQRNISVAVDAFERAYTADPGNAASTIGLSAALLERFRWENSQPDLDRAITILSAPGQAETAALIFNRALAFELAGRREDALSAWRSYVNVETNDRWRAEGQAHIDKLTLPK